MSDLTRRDFIKTTGAVIGATALPSLASASRDDALDTLRVFQIGVGGIGGLDRGRIARHPRAQIVGLCDVDANQLAKVGGEFPEAFRVADYREAFASRSSEFDAVIVCTPDHQHATQVITALAHDKHCYAQKPLVQQLEELELIEKAIAAKPHLATQIGNQRMERAGRRIAVDTLQRDLLGPAVEAWVWTGSRQGNDKPQRKPVTKQPPEHLDWDLWLGPAEVQPYRDDIAPSHWRSKWDFGTSGLGDWGVHLLDIILYSYPELTSPVAVQNNTPRAAGWYHSAHSMATLTYLVESERFQRKQFTVHYHDSGLKPSLRSLGIHQEKVDSNSTCVVCEGGTLLLSADGNLSLWHNGKKFGLADLGANEDVGQYHHWGNWVDQALGVEGHGKVWTPLDVGVRITEAALLPVKASRFPNQELLWDRKNLAFTNNQEATDTCVRRTYRDGFAPPNFWA